MVFDQGETDQDEDVFLTLNLAMVIYVEKYFGEFDPIRAEIYLQCAENLYETLPFMRDQQQEALEISTQHLQKAMDVMKVSHGIDHPKFKMIKEKMEEFVEESKTDSESETEMP